MSNHSFERKPKASAQMRQYSYEQNPKALHKCTQPILGYPVSHPSLPHVTYPSRWYCHISAGLTQRLLLIFPHVLPLTVQEQNQHMLTITDTLDALNKTHQMQRTHIHRICIWTPFHLKITIGVTLWRHAQPLTLPDPTESLLEVPEVTRKDTPRDFTGQRPREDSLMRSTPTACQKQVLKGQSGQ